MPKDLGASCSQGLECASGFCFDGVCCEGDCSAPCMQCNGATPGMCVVTSQPQPDSQRTACAGQGECAGVCDGSSAVCVYPGANQQIVPCGTTPDSCKNEMVRVTSHCNGFGDCASFELNCQETGDPSDPCALKCSGAGVCSAIEMGSACKDPTCNGDQLSTYACDGNHSCAPAVTTCGVACTLVGDQLGCLECNFDDDCVDTSLECVDHACVPKGSTPGVCGGLRDVLADDGSVKLTCAEDQVCEQGLCVATTSCSADSVCGAGRRCIYGVCASSSHVISFNDVPAVGFDESCGCRAVGHSSSPEIVSSMLMLVALTTLVRRRIHATRWLSKSAAKWFLLVGLALVLAACPLPPQEELDADEACKDTAYALSNLVLQCTNNYDKAVEMGDSFDGKFRCNATDVNLTPKYYRCPAELRALSCDDVRAYDLDAEKYLGESDACRALFSHLDGSPILSTAGTAGAGGTSGTAGSSGSAGAGATSGSGGAAGTGGTAGVP